MTGRKGSDPVTHDQLAEALAIQQSNFGNWLKAEVDRLNHAFPDGIDAHRSAHEAQIKAAAAQEEFWRDLKGEIAKKSILGIAHILLILIAVGLSAKLGISIAGFGK